MSSLTAHRGARDSSENAAPTRLRILDRAAHSFVCQGYQGTTLDDVAMSAGVSKLTIYQLIGDKAQLFHTVIAATVAAMTEPMRGLLDGRGSTEEILVRFVENHIRRMMAPIAGRQPFYELAHIMIGSARRPPAVAEECRALFEANLWAPVRHFIEQRVESGELFDYGVDFLTEHFVHMLFPTNALALSPEKAPAPEQIADLARRKVKLFLAGCRTGPAPDSTLLH